MSTSAAGSVPQRRRPHHMERATRLGSVEAPFCGRLVALELGETPLPTFSLLIIVASLTVPLLAFVVPRDVLTDSRSRP